MNLLLLCICLMFARNLVEGKITIEKVEHQADPKFVDIKHEIKEIGGQSAIDIDAHALQDMSDVYVQIAAYSKIDGQYNEFLKPDPVTSCTARQSKDPLVKFVYFEFEKYGNLTQSCPVKKGYYFAKEFMIKDEDLPIPVPNGQYRVDVNATIDQNGKPHKIYSLELFFTNKP